MSWFNEVPSEVREALWGLLGVLITVAGAVAKGWLDRQKQAKLRASNSAFTDAAARKTAIYKSLNALMVDAQADRVQVVVARNGGAIPRAGSKLTASVVDEIHSPNLPAGAETFQEQRLDEQAVRMLHSLDSAGILYLRTDKLQDGITRDAWASQGVGAVVLLRLLAVDGMFMYMAVGFRNVEGMKREDARFRDALRTAQASVRSVLVEDYGAGEDFGSSGQEF